MRKIAQWIFISALFLLFFSASVSASKTAFLVCHSHDDVGYVLTPDQYFERKVHNIYTSVVQQLQLNPERKFIFVEIYYFQRWWTTQTPAVRQQVKTLLSNGQLEFILGGLVMNDEACAHIEPIVNQMTEGHVYVFDELGLKPNYGWQIDPFGHSSMMASLFSMMGFDATVTRRIDYRLQFQYRFDKQLEFTWRGEPSSYGATRDIFTHEMDYGYSSPIGYDLDYDPAITDADLDHMAHFLVDQLSIRADFFMTDNILVPFGGDFEYQNATKYYSSLDKVVAYVNARPSEFNDMHLQYANLHDYFTTILPMNGTSVQFPLVDDADFLPYASTPDTYWTGFYASRPTLKGAGRDFDGYLRAVEQLYLFAHSSPNRPSFGSIYEGRKTQGINQHHDAITGTSKSFVVDWYVSNMQNTTKLLDSAVTLPLLSAISSTPSVTLDRSKAFEMLANKQSVQVSIYNSLAQSRPEFVSVLSPTSLVRVLDAATGQPLSVVQVSEAWDLFPYPDALSYLSTWRASQSSSSSATMYEITFMVQLPSFGFANVIIEVVDAKEDAVPLTVVEKGEEDKNGASGSDIIIENEIIQVVFDSESGAMTSMFNKELQTPIKLMHSFMEYDSNSDGAYVFRPLGDAFSATSGNARLEIVKGPAYQEIRQVFSPSATEDEGAGAPLQAIRLWQAGGELLESFAEVFVQVGTLKGNRQFVTRFNTDLMSQEVWTDDNGAQMRRRPFIADREIAGNVHPAVTTAFMNDGERQLTILSKQSHGASSQFEGSVELMLHRRLLQDDVPALGLGEAMNDTSILRDRLRLMMHNISRSAELRRPAVMTLNSPPLVSFSAASSAVHVAAHGLHFSRSSASYVLPWNIHVLTLQTRDGYSSQVVLRLMHLVSKGDEGGENDPLANPVAVDLSAFLHDLFPTGVSSIRETMLTTMPDLQVLCSNTQECASSSQTTITLTALDIKTFLVTL